MSAVELFHLGIKALIVDPEAKILLLKVNLEELSGYEGSAYWDIPGGRVNKGDSMLDTLTREIAEETGIKWEGPADQIGTVQSKIRVPTDRGDVALALVVYRCRVARRPDIRLSEEHVEWRWMDSNEAAAALDTKYPPEFCELLRKF